MTSPHLPPASPPPDEPLGRAVAALRHLPAVPPGAVDRVVAAAVARNGVAGRRSGVATWLARAAGLALAAGLGAATAHYGFGRGEPAPAVAAADSAPVAGSSAPAPTAGYQLATGAEEGPVETAFVLARGAARRVAVVGDFNGWDPTANPMAADARGVWTATVALAPGRHAYAFVVDDTLWVTDPRAPVARDADYGRDQSIVLVGRP